jgi:UPF0755 protein
MRFTYIVIIGFILIVFGMGTVFLKPVSLVDEVSVELPYGTSVIKSANLLEEAGVIKSKESFVILSKIIHPRGIVAGRYYFSGKVSLFSALEQISKGDFGREQIKLTIPEGFTTDEIIKRINKLFPNIDQTIIKNGLAAKEGFIYPETYFFDTNIKADEIILDLTNRSNKKIAALISPIDINSKEAKRIINVASLLESEGRTFEERKMIASIIENRLSISMPLQLDASLQYVTGRGSSELTLKDLKMDSPYNTYVYKGLPPTPISNPGKESIEAALKPTKNDYLYYLHDKEGNIHYAKTFEEHVRNKNKYLK